MVDMMNKDMIVHVCYREYRQSGTINKQCLLAIWYMYMYMYIVCSHVAE